MIEMGGSASGAVLRPVAAPPGAAQSTLGELAKRASTDDLAFRELYDRIKRPVYTFLFRMVGHMGEAEELMQETLLKVHRNLSRLNSEESFLGWTFSIARNTAISHLRKKRPRVEPIEEVAEPASAFSEHAAAEVSVDLQRILLRIPPRYRSIFILGVIEQREYADIARMSGKSLAAVKTDIHRAREMVREQWLRLRDGKSGGNGV
ncbi:MAG: RNA polymerase sigma factor [Acidobacteria bacterium]|nr:RNA polymerase sigma factor [Acidobacteriota bacterium]